MEANPHGPPNADPGRAREQAVGPTQGGRAISPDEDFSTRASDVGGTAPAEPLAGATRFEPTPTTSESAVPPVAGDQSQETTEQGSPLDAAAAQGPMSWPEDDEVDPPGTPEPIRVSTSDDAKPTYIGIPGGSAGGH